MSYRFGDVFAGIIAAAGLEDHVTAHVLRHTFGTSLVRQGVDLVTVAQLMGTPGWRPPADTRWRHKTTWSAPWARCPWTPDGRPPWH